MIEELIGVLREHETLSELTAEQFTDIFWLAIQQSRFSERNHQELLINSQNHTTTVVVEEKLQPADTQPSTLLSSLSSKSQETQKLLTVSQPKANIYAKTVSSNTQESKGAGTLPIRVPDAASLPNKLELARALKSLMRHVPSIYDTVLDEVATIERIANEQLWIPVLKPALEPWLELDLVVDEGASMLIWRDTILELQQLLENLGAFRNVRTWSLFTNQKQKVQIRPGIGSAVSKQYDHSPRELVNSNGRRLILVLSDCLSPMWGDGVQNRAQNESIISVLSTWTNTSPLAIVQMLPKWLWAKTALSLAPTVQLSGLAPGVVNQQLQVKQLSLWDEIDEDQDIKVPVLTLEPEMVATWSQMVAGKGTVWTSGVVFRSNGENLNNEDEPNDSSTELTAKQRFQRFRLTASPTARRLAGLVAVAPVVTLPIIRLIQQTMLPQSSQVHIAEVLLGGLVKLKPETKIAPDTNPNEVEYQFIDGVDEILVNSLPATDKVIVKFNLLEQLTKHIADKIGLSTDTFAGFLRDPRQIGSITQQSNPIATLAFQKLKALGENYADFAKQLEDSFNPLEVKTILILAANPESTSRLQLDQEIRAIDEGLRRGNKRSQFKLEQKWAVRQRDFYRAILDYQPQIIHFSGHGTGLDGIVLGNEADEPAFVNADALASMFKLFATKGVECVLLNACYSEVQAKAISQHVNYVIGMNRTIGDKAAIAFSVAFYDAIAAGQQMEFAYELGCSVLISYSEQQTPVLLKKDRIGIVQPLFDVIVIPPNPYVGLAAFVEEDAAFFFGRETFVNGLLEAVNKQPLVGVIGPSGSGKSSVVYTGLFPQLRTSGNWLIESFRPGDKPFYQLASVLVRLLEPETGETAQLRKAVELAADMEPGRITLPMVISRLLERYSRKHLLLFIDQFEELYTLCQNKEVIERFIDALLAAINLDNFTLVFTLRADFYNFVLAYRPFCDALQQFSPQLLSSMNREELLRAIEQPAHKMEVQLEAQLTQRILDDVSNEPGNLLLLEFALTRLWSLQQRRLLTHQAYDEIGGVKKALANHAEQIYQQLNEQEQKQARRIFVQLVRPGEGTEDTRRIATRFEVGDKNWGLVSYLAGYPARLVVTGRDEKSGEDTVEVVHEALIREWLTLREWMKQDRSFRAWQERIRAAIHQWEETKRDEGALLRGMSLVEAEEKLKERRQQLSPSEQNFIQQSLELRDRLRQPIFRRLFSQVNNIFGKGNQKS